MSRAAPRCHASGDPFSATANVAGSASGSSSNSRPQGKAETRDDLAAVEFVLFGEDADVRGRTIDIDLTDHRIDHPDEPRAGSEVVVHFHDDLIGPVRVAHDLDGQVRHHVPGFGVGRLACRTAIAIARRTPGPAVASGSERRRSGRGSRRDATEAIGLASMLVERLGQKIGDVRFRRLPSVATPRSGRRRPHRAHRPEGT